MKLLVCVILATLVSCKSTSDPSQDGKLLEIVGDGVERVKTLRVDIGEELADEIALKTGLYLCVAKSLAGKNETGEREYIFYVWSKKGDCQDGVIEIEGKYQFASRRMKIDGILMEELLADIDGEKIAVGAFKTYTFSRGVGLSDTEITHLCDGKSGDPYSNCELSVADGELKIAI